MDDNVDNDGDGGDYGEYDDDNGHDYNFEDKEYHSWLNDLMNCGWW